ncbi:cytidylyl-2-hydroxypropylphosphonate hydrolase [Streptomyces erythrochromogenes]|uniref:cytidylyl-2-hydroxypropylphosphonate hydrolase n=1 Tax=Streptomyces erythrochromogenes TaxID=285574 RepID=UPI0036FEBF4C
MTGTFKPGSGRAPGAQPNPARGTRWAPGDQILWRYRDHAPGLEGPVHICRPVTVVQDTDEMLAVWMAPGTECVKPVLADGTSVHEEPLATRYTAPRTTARSRWFGGGVLKLARPGDPWSVWLFWGPGWTFKNWYVNLEEPRSRWAGGVDSEDHFLDIAVYPDRSWKWLDEDEFAQAQKSGLMGREQARRVREAGRAAVAVIEEWGVPFSAGWQEWRPDPAWRIPALPEDWDRTPAHMTS